MKTVEVVDRSPMIDKLNDMLELDPARTAIVAIDMHRGHLDPEVATMPCSPAVCDSVIANTERLLAFCRGNGLPVIHVVVVNRDIRGVGSEASIRPFFQYMNRIKEETDRLAPGRRTTVIGHNMEGSVQTEIMPRLYDESDYVIDYKKRQDCFIGTDLELLLQTVGADTVVIVGINTNTCVLNTAFTSANKNYKVVVVSDCVGTMYGDDLHEFALQNISRCLGWVLTIDEFEGKVSASLPERVAAS
ncbi:MAG: cysteine hydrolase [Defluviicoccus sp.]|nr:cysteine hydrolase [Defluviicoccus sp.]MDE0382356.1 cysteine hydrolase [Defluviicoccus sp.]